MTVDTRQKVLVVDDNEDNRIVLERFLVNCGYAVTTCDSGQAALALVSKQTPDIMLLDWMMPGVSGLETLCAIRELYDSVRLPIIMCTALDEDVSVVSAISLGANDYVTKPINLAILRARMALHLKQRSMMVGIVNEKADVEQRLGEQTRRLLGSADDQPGPPPRADGDAPGGNA